MLQTEGPTDRPTFEQTHPILEVLERTYTVSFSLKIPFLRNSTCVADRPKDIGKTHSHRGARIQQKSIALYTSDIKKGQGAKFYFLNQTFLIKSIQFFSSYSFLFDRKN